LASQRSLDLKVSDLGQTQLKNIAEPIHLYSLQVGVPAAAGSAPKKQAAKSVAKPRRASWRWPAVAAALAVALVGAGGYAWHAGLAPRLLGVSIAEDKLNAAPRLSLVVLPFENLSGDKGQDYFADGVTDDLTTDLSRIPDSFVIARNTAFTYKGKPVNAKEIGRELGVRYVLEGSVRREGESVEVDAQLISTETGAHVWATGSKAREASSASCSSRSSRGSRIRSTPSLSAPRLCARSVTGPTIRTRSISRCAALRC
jgi:TolB-like protein